MLENVCVLPQICSDMDNPSMAEEWEAQLLYDCERYKKKTCHFMLDFIQMCKINMLRLLVPQHIVRLQ